ncbi:hypothetical protein ACHAWF_008483 [Thalassiosira exigua]
MAMVDPPVPPFAPSPAADDAGAAPPTAPEEAAGEGGTSEESEEIPPGETGGRGGEDAVATSLPTPSPPADGADARPPPPSRPPQRRGERTTKREMAAPPDRLGLPLAATAPPGDGTNAATGGSADGSRGAAAAAVAAAIDPPRPPSAAKVDDPVEGEGGDRTRGFGIAPGPGVAAGGGGAAAAASVAASEGGRTERGGGRNEAEKRSEGGAGGTKREAAGEPKDDDDASAPAAAATATRKKAKKGGRRRPPSSSSLALLPDRTATAPRPSRLAAEAAAVVAMRDREQCAAWLRMWTTFQQFRACEQLATQQQQQSRADDGSRTVDRAAADDDDRQLARRLGELRRYKFSHGGDCNDVPLHYRDPEDESLGQWARRQRELHAEGKLSEGTTRALREEGFDFSHEPEAYTGDEVFDEKLRELMEYKKERSDCDVPLDHDGASEPLGRWVHRQREQYDAGTLDEKRHALLEEKGLAFEPGTDVTSTVLTEAWKKSYGELVQFKRDHGHLEVPQNYKATSVSPALYRWIAKQKNKHKHQKLSRNRIKLLEEVGIVFGERKKHVPGERGEERWEARLSELIAYRDERGHCNVPNRFPSLGNWVKDQRKLFRRGQLRDRRVRRLLSVGFDFNPSNKMGGGEEELAYAANNDGATSDVGGEMAVVPAAPDKDAVFHSAAWTENCDALKSFVKANGHADVPPEHKADGLEGSLRTWIETQKRFSREGVLPRRNAEMLEGLGVDLSEATDHAASRNDAMWMRSFKALERFYKEEGHTDVRPRVLSLLCVRNDVADIEDVSHQVPNNVLLDNSTGGKRTLASWLKKQREIYRQNNAKMPAERVALLRGLGIDLSLKKKPGNKPKSYHLLGKMPDDDLWFEDHDDGERRRIPRDWKFPRLNLEEMYVLFHCGDKEKKISPMKMLKSSDMVAAAPRDGTNLQEVSLLCSFIDKECVRKGIVKNGIMSEEDARSCVRVGYPSLKVTLPDGVGPDEVLKMKWTTVFNRKNVYGRQKA